MATAALLSCGPVYIASAAITPPKGGCKPIADEPPADAKDKATNPGTGNKGVRPAGDKPAKSTDRTV